MKLSVKEREFFRKRVQTFLGKNPSWKNSDVVKHFELEGTARRTVYNTLNKLKTSQPIKETNRTGRPSTWKDGELQQQRQRKQRLKRLTNNRTGCSQRSLGRKFDVSQKTIGRQLSIMGIKYRRREKTPKYSVKQAKRARIASRQLLNLLRETEFQVVIDDEKYFTLSGDNMPENRGYYTDNKQECPESVRFVGKTKFTPKMLMWIAISERGVSQPLFRRNNSESINSAIYIDECLSQRLLPFLHKYHPDFEYVFWPDLASAHYAKATVAWMDENINFVPKNLNPPNVPQARPIENFWGCLAQKVYKGGWQARTEDELIRRITTKLKEFDANFFPTLMRGLNGKLKNIVDKGVLGSFK